MAAQDLVRTDRTLKMRAFQMDPPSWTRLEPVSITGNPRPGLEMRVHDPLWMLARQWQFGELTGEDAGTPLIVNVATESSPMARWATEKGGPRDLRAGDLLEPVVEAEPAGDAAGGWARAEAGQAFVALVEDAGAGGAVLAGVRGRFPHDGVGLPPGLAMRAVDGELVALALEAAAGGLPPWLDPNEPAVAGRLRAAAGSWLAWYRAEVTPPPRGESAWVPDHLEYRFRVAAAADGGPVELKAPEFLGGAVDWWSFDLPSEPGDAVGVPDGAVATSTTSGVWASPLRFPGMPADRLWEFEDGAVNLGALEVQPHDLARLLFAEFALATGSDWLVVPVDVPHGSVSRVQWVTYSTTFGERFLVPHTSAVAGPPPPAGKAAGRWQMFTITGDDRHVLVGAPAAAALMEGSPVEDVRFLRDEMANLVWAVERRYQDGDGTVRSRDRGVPVADDPPAGDGLPELVYRLASTVPENWIPYVPMSSGYRTIRLHRAVVPGQPVLAPLGKLLPEIDGLVDGEVPREGVQVQRVPVVARRADGTWERWLARRVQVGRGEGSSGLQFDSATRRPD